MAMRIKAEEWELRQVLGERLRQVRKDRGLSRYRLAQEIGASTQAISFYENGLKSPSLVRFRDLARALNVSPRYLLEGPRPGSAATAMTCGTKVTMGPEMLDPEFRNRVAPADGEGKTGQER